MTDAEQVVSQKKTTPFDKVIKGLDFTLRVLGLLAAVLLAIMGFFIVLMGANKEPIMAFGALAVGSVLLGILAISAIDPDRLTRRLPVSGNIRVLLGRLPFCLAILLVIYFFT